MATATEIATRALRRIRVLSPDETISDADLTACKDALNAMVASWEAGALSGDTLPLEARFEQGVVAMLAVRVAGDYGKQPDPILMRDAERGERALDGAFFAVPQQKFDAGLIYTGQDTTEILLGQTTGDYAAWQASTAYLVRETVTNLGNIYECVTAGTSASSGGPTGTDSEITDDTVTWCFRRVDGS